MRASAAATRFFSPGRLRVRGRSRCGCTGDPERMVVRITAVSIPGRRGNRIDRASRSTRDNACCSAAFVDRLDAAVASLKPDEYVPVDLQPVIDALKASAMAHHEGRPYSHWHNPLRPPQPELDPTSPRGQLLARSLELRGRMQAQPEWAEEEAERERRQARMLVLIRRDERRRAERAEKKRLAVVQAHPDAGLQWEVCALIL
jgi:hypothetical protein